MENAGDVDQFASPIIPNCQPTASQEEKLKSCPFARESEVFSGGMQLSSSPDEASEQPTGILMVSLPESSDDYQTPPEQHFYSQNSSNDGQVAATKTAAVDREKESGGVGEGETMVVDDDCERQGHRVFDLNNDSDNIGFSEKSPRVLLDDNNTLRVDDTDTEKIEAESRADETDAENWATEARRTGLISSPKESTHEVFVEMPQREQEASISASTVNTTLNRGKRKLPLSVNVRDQNNGEKGDHSKHEAFRNCLDRALKMLVGEAKGGGDEDIDILETAKSRGMTFPRPRWWPPEVATRHRHKLDTIHTPIVDGVMKALEKSRLDLHAVVKDPLPEALHLVEHVAKTFKGKVMVIRIGLRSKQMEMTTFARNEIARGGATPVITLKKGHRHPPSSQGGENIRDGPVQRKIFCGRVWNCMGKEIGSGFYARIRMFLKAGMGLI